MWQFTVFLRLSLEMSTDRGKGGADLSQQGGKKTPECSQRGESRGGVQTYTRVLKISEKNDHLHSFNCVKSKKQKHIQPNTHTHTHTQTHTQKHTQHAIMRSCAKIKLQSLSVISATFSLQMEKKRKLGKNNNVCFVSWVSNTLAELAKC